jgi:hypothetical protein
MILAIVNMKAGNYFLQRAFLAPLQEMTTCFTPTFLSEDNGDHGIRDHKPPKASYAKHETLTDFAGLLSVSTPPSSIMSFSEPFTALPEVFVEILVPPKIVC